MAITPSARTQASSISGGCPATVSRSHPGAIPITRPKMVHSAASAFSTRRRNVMEGRSPQLGRGSGGLVGYANRGSAPVSSHARLRFETPEPQRTFGMQQGPRVAVIGLDCGTPQLLFRDLIDEIPNIRKLMDGGMHGDLASITPPITVPAWACAMTGKTPGQLGLYGFRNRKDHTYDGLSIATSGSIHEPAVWDKLAEKGMRSLLIGVPPSFPPPKEFPGWRIGCFLTPPSAKRFAFPEELEVEVAEELGGPGNYIFDIPNFREQGMQFVLDQVFAMTERRFKVARRLVKNKPWDYFMMVEMGPDRLHHVFWQYFDPRHPLYVPGQRVRDRVPGLLPLPGPGGRRAAGGPAGRRHHDRDVGSRRPSDDGRPLLQRLVDAGGLPRDDREGHRADADREGAGRLEPHDRVGRRRLLRALLPEREGPRAAGRRSSRSGTKRSATS